MGATSLQKSVLRQSISFTDDKIVVVIMINHMIKLIAHPYWGCLYKSKYKAPLRESCLQTLSIYMRNLSWEIYFLCLKQ